MTTLQMRNLVKAVFPTKKWASKVDAMQDPQVFAIFCKLKNKGRIRL